MASRHSSLKRAMCQIAFGESLAKEVPGIDAITADALSQVIFDKFERREAKRLAHQRPSQSAIHVEPQVDASKFLEQYNFETTQSGKNLVVHFSIPRSYNIGDLFVRCNTFCSTIGRKRAIDPNFLPFSEAMGMTTKSEDLSIIPLFHGSLGRYHGEQQRVMKDTPYRSPHAVHVAAAIALYFCKTGKDPLDGCIVRTYGPSLIFGHNGVKVALCDDNVTHEKVGCAAMIAA